jgi:ketosteroid isomerase-like protein
VVNADPQAFREGTVGWAADHPTFEMPGGIQIASRLTAVFHQEDGEWKLVQQHISTGVRNEDLLGIRLTRD